MSRICNLSFPYPPTIFMYWPTSPLGSALGAVVVESRCGPAGVMSGVGSGLGDVSELLKQTPATGSTCPLHNYLGLCITPTPTAIVGVKRRAHTSRWRGRRLGTKGPSCLSIVSYTPRHVETGPRGGKGRIRRFVACLNNRDSLETCLSSHHRLMRTSLFSPSLLKPQQRRNAHDFNNACLPTSTITVSSGLLPQPPK